MGNASSAVLLGGVDSKYYTGDFVYHKSYKCVLSVAYAHLVHIVGCRGSTPFL